MGYRWKCTGLFFGVLSLSLTAGASCRSTYSGVSKAVGELVALSRHPNGIEGLTPKRKQIVDQILAYRDELAQKSKQSNYDELVKEYYENLEPLLHNTKIFKHTEEYQDSRTHSFTPVDKLPQFAAEAFRGIKLPEDVLKNLLSQLERIPRSQEEIERLHELSLRPGHNRRPEATTTTLNAKDDFFRRVLKQQVADYPDQMATLATSLGGQPQAWLTPTMVHQFKPDQRQALVKRLEEVANHAAQHADSRERTLLYSQITYLFREKDSYRSRSTISYLSNPEDATSPKLSMQLTEAEIESLFRMQQKLGANRLIYDSTDPIYPKVAARLAASPGPLGKFAQQSISDSQAP